MYKKEIQQKCAVQLSEAKKQSDEFLKAFKPLQEWMEKNKVSVDPNKILELIFE